MKTPPLKTALIVVSHGSYDAVSVRGSELIANADVVFVDAGVNTAVLAHATPNTTYIPVAPHERQHDTARIVAYSQKGERAVWLTAEDSEAFANTWIQAVRSAGGIPVVFRSTATVSTDGPLSNRRILITRALPQTPPMCQLLSDLGAEPIAMPTIAIVPVNSSDKAQRAMAELNSFSYIIFTSVNAVNPFRDALWAAGYDTRNLADKHICAIGPATANALRDLGLRADIIAKEYRAEGLLDLLPSESMRGKRVLLFRAEIARTILVDTLTARGATVNVVTAYRTIGAPKLFYQQGLDRLRRHEVDAVTFTSPSTAHHFAQIAGDEMEGLLSRVTIATIGPVTADACRKIGINVDIMAVPYTVSALVDAIAQYFSKD